MEKLEHQDNILLPLSCQKKKINKHIYSLKLSEKNNF